MKIQHIKNLCKIEKKYNNPDNLTLMQIQHKKAKELGFYNWKELLEKLGE